MEFLNCHLGINEFFDRNPFVLFLWKSFPMDEIVNCIFDML